MAGLPVNVTYGTVTGRFLTAEQLDTAEPDGVPISGSVKFKPRPKYLKDAADNSIILPKEISATLDGTGFFSVQLIATDDVDLNPLDWTYQVTFVFNGGVSMDPFDIEVPGNVVTDLADVAPAAVGNGVFYLVGPPGPQKTQPGGLMGPGVQGLYQRRKPVGPSGSGWTTGFYALAKDLTNAVRVWGIGLDFSTFGMLDNGANYTAKTVIPGAGAVHQALFTTGHAWMTTGSNSDRSGQVWRSPLPDANGNGLTWTKVFDLGAMPGGLTSGVNSCLRPQCLAVAPNGASWHVYVLEYSINPSVTVGPSLYYSPDAGATWSKVKTWANAKHGHAVKVIGGTPVVMLGDAGTAWTDIGLHKATTAAATVWNPLSVYGEGKGGNTLYGINFQPLTVAGKAMLAIEYDGALNLGPLLFPDSGAGATQWPILQTFRLPPTYFGTMRCLTLTSEGNLMWVQTTENGAFGPNDTIWISQPPFMSAVLLDSFAASTMFLGDPIEIGDEVVFGYYWCRKERFRDS